MSDWFDVDDVQQHVQRTDIKMNLMREQPAVWDRAGHSVQQYAHSKRTRNSSIS